MLVWSITSLFDYAHRCNVPHPRAYKQAIQDRVVMGVGDIEIDDCACDSDKYTPFSVADLSMLLSIATVEIVAVTQPCLLQPLGPVLGYAPLILEFLLLLAVILAFYVVVVR